METRRIARQGRIPIILPSKALLRPNPLKPSEDVTSDSTAASIARLLKARRLILITDLDGIQEANPKVHLGVSLIATI
ncbi:MAG: hypothetical protein QXI39_02750 [Candidatus Bathyarchaeia archaeon]